MGKNKKRHGDYHGKIKMRLDMNSAPRKKRDSRVHILQNGQPERHGDSDRISATAPFARGHLRAPTVLLIDVAPLSCVYYSTLALKMQEGIAKRVAHSEARCASEVIFDSEVASQ